MPAVVLEGLGTYLGRPLNFLADFHHLPVELSFSHAVHSSAGAPRRAASSMPKHPMSSRFSHPVEALG